jgi:hypothetical protein
MKKRYNINLDEQAVEELREWVKEQKISLSGFINALIREHNAAARELKGIKNVSEVTIGQALKLYELMQKGLDETRKEEEVKKK